MALVIPKGAKLSTNDPTSSLTAPLTGFEATLNDDQRLNAKYHVVSIKPDASSIVGFVAPFDKTADGKHQKTCIFAPRDFFLTHCDCSQALSTC
jgi:hypothetical protein